MLRGQWDCGGVDFYFFFFFPVCVNKACSLLQIAASFLVDAFYGALRF